MNRRKFFNFLPLAPAIGAAIVIENMNKSDKPKQSLLTLQGYSYSQPTKSNVLSFSSIDYDYAKTVQFGIGEDGALWLKSAKEDWKKVKVE